MSHTECFNPLKPQEGTSMAMYQLHDLTTICTYVLTLYDFDFNANKCKTCSFSSRCASMVVYQTKKRFPVLFFTLAGPKISERTFQMAQKVLTALVFMLVHISTTSNGISSNILLLYFTILSDRLSQLLPALTL